MELAQLASMRLVVTMLLPALVNAGTFAILTFIAPIVTETAASSQWWVSAALVLFGVGSFDVVTIAGRLSDARPRAVIATGAPIMAGSYATAALNVGAAAGPVLAAAALRVMPGALGPVWVAVIVTAAAVLLVLTLLRLISLANTEVLRRHTQTCP